MDLTKEEFKKGTEKGEISKKIKIKKEKPPTLPIKKNSKKCFWILIISIAVAIIVIGIVVLMVLKGGKGKEDKKDNTQNGSSQTQDNFEIIEDSAQERVGPKEKEFDIVTKPGDLKQISVTQRSKDETKINNKTIFTENIRKTDYNIYIIQKKLQMKVLVNITPKCIKDVFQ